MDILREEHKALLITLITCQVDFMLIGGYAVIHYGYERTTSDMDIWLKPTKQNSDKLIVALRQYGIIEEDLEELSKLDFTKAEVFSIGDKPDKIDFLTRVQGLEFEVADERKVFFPLKDLQIPIVQYHHLIQIKMIAGRIQDMADIEILQKINQFRKNKW